MLFCRLGLAGLLALLGLGLGAAPVEAQRMDLALSRLRVNSDRFGPGSTIPGTESYAHACGSDADCGAGNVCDPGSGICTTAAGGPALVGDVCSAFTGGYERDWCQDDDAWRRIATEFTGALIPPLLTPARTRGPRSFYLGIEGAITGISHGDGVNGVAWSRGTEGDQPIPSGAEPYNRFAESALGWTRLNIRKALPFGFDLGTNIGYLANTSYWALGLEIRWALLEGWQSRDWWVPDIAIRGAVQTLVGDAEFNATAVALDLTVSNAVILGDQFELSPYLAGQLAWAFADTELVDLTPDRDAFAECNPGPTEHGSNPCNPSTGDGSDYNHNVVFPSIRTMRPRMVFGLQARYEVFVVTGAFSFDLLTPSEMDNRLPQPIRDPETGALVRAGIDRQWRIDMGIGLVY